MKKKLVTFSKDGREPIEFLFQSFSKLKKAGWHMFEVFRQEEKQDTAKFSLPIPILCFTSLNKGPALWILSGVHGEESASPNALARNIDILLEIARTIPVVVFPLLNPTGYIRDWRYPNEYRDWHKGHSVSSAEHLLLDYKNPEMNQPRISRPESKEAEAVISKVIELICNYPPLFSIDHHEDELSRFSYVYSQGPRGVKDPIAKEVIKILKSTGFFIQEYGHTRFGEKVEGGIVFSAHDGSIGELMSAKQIILNGKLVDGPSAPSSIVIETPIVNVSLEKRITAHEAVIKSYERLFLIAKEFSLS